MSGDKSQSHSRDKQGKHIIIGVTGSIAAYKAIDITSQLVKADCKVEVILTSDAQEFVTPLSFKTLSRNEVVTDLYDEEDGWKPTHIRMADEADILLIAPATANTIAKLAHGMANDALTCTALALNSDATLIIAPAMNGKMWLHPATQANVEVLRKRGALFIGPEEGMLSCGYEGVGRLMQSEAIVQFVLNVINPS